MPPPHLFFTPSQISFQTHCGFNVLHRPLFHFEKGGGPRKGEGVIAKWAHSGLSITLNLGSIQEIRLCKSLYNFCLECFKVTAGQFSTFSFTPSLSHPLFVIEIEGLTSSEVVHKSITLLYGMVKQLLKMTVNSATF